MIRKKKYSLPIIFILTVIVVCVYKLTDEDGFNFNYPFGPKISAESVEIHCYDEDFEKSALEILDNAEVVKNNSIFFFETSCNDGHLKLNPRQACAIESAVKLNRNSQVYLIIPSPIKHNSFGDPIKQLLSYENFNLRQIEMKKFFLNTPLELWYKKGVLKTSKWPRSHASDILRYTVLWKYGGIYIDLDVVLIKSFENLENFAGAESDVDIAAGFLSFSHNHPLANITMNDLQHNYRGYDWGYNGPGVITRALKSYCQVEEISKMTLKNCKGFKVFMPSVFYPIPWRDWKDYFVTKAKDVERVMAKINDSYAIHVWNYHSRTKKVVIGSNQPYSIIASKYCPKVYSTLKNFF